MWEILIGAVSGIISGTGMGGGTILILCLSLFMGMNQHEAQASNLVFFIPTSIVAIWVNIKQKLIKWEIAIPITISGVIGAIIGAVLSNKTDVNNLRRYFGVFLLIITIHEIYTIIIKYIIYKKRNNKTKSI